MCVQVVVSIKRWTAIVIAIATLLSACDVGCEAACRKVLKCDGLETNEVTVGECNAECVRQSESYDDREDEAGAEAFANHKNCLKRSTCDEILEGECYDPTVFTF